MIDTVRFKLNPVKFKGLELPGWEMHKHISPGEDGFPIESSWYQHKESALRIGGTHERSSWLEVSLPRLFYGSNGYLLRPKDMNSAVTAAFDLASDVLTDYIDPDQLTRYDLVHHFLGDARDYVCALRGLKHKRVRKVAVEFFESGLEWPGTNVYIRLYDKRAEMERCPGEIQRLEFQLRRKALRSIWDLKAGFDSEKCFNQYKDLAGQFATRSVPRIGSVNELLCWLRTENVRVNGIDPVERFLASRKRSQRYEIEKSLNSVRLEFFDAKFTSQLPADLKELEFFDCVPRAKEAAA